METRKVDFLNIGLIVLSLLAAFWMPFAVFLFSYAVLGPLHYMTEINWLDERSYFSKSKATPWILGVLVVLLCLGSFFAEGASNTMLAGFRDAVNHSFAQGLFQLLSSLIVHFAFLAFVTGVALAAFEGWLFRALVILIGIAIAVMFNGNSTYTLLVGSMLPTVIHVCLFTGLFMLYGALKSKSRPGLASVAVFILAYIIIAQWPIDERAHYLATSDPVANSFMQSGFHNVMYQFGLFTGLIPQGTNFVINSELGVRLGIFLAFAYTYHYLNWFSKTSVIRWHKVSRRKLAGALIIWVGSMALYAVNYRLGLLALLFLSLLHVFFEIPLNYVSVSGIFSELKNRLRVGVEK